MKKRTGLITAVALTLTTAAIAQNTNRPVAGKFVVSDAQRSAAAAFWTNDLLENATPMPLPTLDPLSVRTTDNTLPVAGEPRVSKPGGAPTFFPSKEEQPSLEPIPAKHPDMAPTTTIQPEGFGYEMPFTNHRMASVNMYPHAAVGKLFFYIPAGASEPSGTYVCSASVAMNNHTLITARHCMFDYATGKWYQNFTFYPAYSNGGNPAYNGGWTIRKLTTWVSGASTYDYDIGFMQVNDNKGYGCAGSSGGLPIGSYTGWLGYTYGGDYSQRQWDIFGYPAAPPFGGAYQWDDEAGTGTLNPLGTTNIIEVGNPQTGGTSGGPWIIGFDPQNLADQNIGNNTAPTYTNLVNGLNSFKWTNPNHPESINGPAFYAYNFWNLFTAYSGNSCP